MEKKTQKKFDNTKKFEKKTIKVNSKTTFKIFFYFLWDKSSIFIQ